jgi:hypothetical protein
VFSHETAGRVRSNTIVSVFCLRYFVLLEILSNINQVFRKTMVQTRNTRRAVWLQVRNVVSSNILSLEQGSLNCY